MLAARRENPPILLEDWIGTSCVRFSYRVCHKAYYLTQTDIHCTSFTKLNYIFFSLKEEIIISKMRSQLRFLLPVIQVINGLAFSVCK